MRENWWAELFCVLKWETGNFWDEPCRRALKKGGSKQRDDANLSVFSRLLWSLCQCLVCTGGEGSCGSSPMRVRKGQHLWDGRLIHLPDWFGINRISEPEDKEPVASSFYAGEPANEAHLTALGVRFKPVPSASSVTDTTVSMGVTGRSNSIFHMKTREVKWQAAWRPALLIPGLSMFFFNSTTAVPGIQEAERGVGQQEKSHRSIRWAM